MGITIPSVPATISTSETGSQAVIKRTTWESAAESQHYTFAYTGARIPGRYFSTPATTTSGTFTQTNATGPSLDTWMPHSQVLRKCNDAGSDAAVMELQIFGNNVQVRLTLFDIATGTTIDTITASVGTWGWATNTEIIAWASVSGKNLAYKLEFLSTSGTGSLVTWAAHEAHIAATNIP